VGTVTLNPQDGNPRPRVFRIEPESLLNHLGFPNDGVAKISTNIASYEQLGFPLGVSLGINKDTPHTQAAEDLAILAHILAPVADYLVINFSSPNTPQLRDVLYSQLLSEILSGVRVQSMNKPIWLKVPPDLTLEQLDQLIRFVVDHRVQGVIATNTTIDYTVLPHDTVFEPVKGGLSGQVLRSKSTAVLEHLYKESGGKIDLIGSGGVTSLESLLEKFSVGAKAVSLYTGLVYTGPTLPSQLNRDLVEWLTQHKVSLAELVGQKL
jgi:dihydroorotate dehydrogenase